MNKKAQFGSLIVGLLCSIILLILALISVAPFVILIFIIYKVWKKFAKNPEVKPDITQEQKP